MTTTTAAVGVYLNAVCSIATPSTVSITPPPSWANSQQTSLPRSANQSSSCWSSTALSVTVHLGCCSSGCRLVGWEVVLLTSGRMIGIGWMPTSTVPVSRSRTSPFHPYSLPCSNYPPSTSDWTATCSPGYLKASQECSS